MDLEQFSDPPLDRQAGPERLFAIRRRSIPGPHAAATENAGMGPGHYENFPVASVLCPPRLRPAILAIYRFARTADDIADEGDSPASLRLSQLERYREALTAAANGKASGPWQQVFEPLAEQIRIHRLPVGLLDDLLDAFMQDTRNPAYADRGQLLDYCRRSANPIGRLLLHLYGVDDEPSLQDSDAICTALQLINFWQDLSVDLPRGRCYLPLADAERWGLRIESIGDLAADRAARGLVRELLDWSVGLMESGAPLALRLPGRSGWELRFVVAGGLRIADRIAATDYASLRHRPSLSLGDLPLLLWTAATIRRRCRRG